MNKLINRKEKEKTNKQKQKKRKEKKRKTKIGSTRNLTYDRPFFSGPFSLPLRQVRQYERDNNIKKTFPVELPLARSV